MRPLNKIILHCSATPDEVPITVEQINRWHKKRGFTEIGYHYIIHQDGKIEQGRDLDVVGAHCKGQNPGSIGVCYIGGLKDGEFADTMTGHQEIAWLDLVHSLRTIFGKLSVHGHNEFSNKACPCFDVQTKYTFLNLTK
jgi:N-acetylmuramoyl-L-alanine amidase